MLSKNFIIRSFRVFEEFFRQLLVRRQAFRRYVLHTGFSVSHGLGHVKTRSIGLIDVSTARVPSRDSHRISPTRQARQLELTIDHFFN